jgi:hypothetical protein
MLVQSKGNSKLEARFSIMAVIGLQELPIN